MSKFAVPLANVHQDSFAPVVKSVVQCLLRQCVPMDNRQCKRASEMDLRIAHQDCSALMELVVKLSPVQLEDLHCRLAQWAESAPWDSYASKFVFIIYEGVIFLSETNDEYFEGSMLSGPIAHLSNWSTSDSDLHRPRTQHLSTKLPMHQRRLLSVLVSATHPRLSSDPTTSVLLRQLQLRLSNVHLLQQWHMLRRQ